MKLDVRIMAHPSRRSMVENTLKQIGCDESIVSWDDSGLPLNGARKAWLAPIPEGVTHRLVLQDDIEVVDNFIPTVEKIVSKFPHAALTFYAVQTDVTWKSKKTDSPYLKMNGCCLTGETLLLPVSIINECFNWIRETFGDDYKHDDCAIGLFLYLHGYNLFLTLPNLAQHLCPMNSLLKGHNKAYKVSSTYLGKNGADDVDWNNTNYSVSNFFTNSTWLDSKDPRHIKIKTMIKERRELLKRWKK